jgi:hypothetical protein
VPRTDVVACPQAALPIAANANSVTAASDKIDKTLLCDFVVLIMCTLAFPLDRMRLVQNLLPAKAFPACAKTNTVRGFPIPILDVREQAIRKRR